MATQKRERTYRTLTPGSIEKWKKGRIVEGQILEIRDSPNPRFEGKGHILDLAVDGIKTAFGCPTVLYNYLRQIDIGDYVRIECLGKIATPRGKAWDFKVEVETSSDDDTDNDAE